MHKQDTATLNQPELLRRVEELQLKQAWLASRIRVTPLTVNRWLNGKVRRISRDNLAQLATALNCSAESLSLADETDVEASEREQSKAARLLVARESQQLFISGGQLENYERLIKAVMHPRLPLSDLAEIYSALTIAAAKQGKLAETRRYARLKLEYSLRTGDAPKELAARANLITLDAEEGRLLKARRGLEDLLSSAESQGVTRGTSIPMINLVQVYRLLGNPARAIAIAIRCLKYLATQPGTEWSSSYAFGNAASCCMDCGSFGLASRLKKAEIRLSAQKHTPPESAENSLFLLAAAGLGGQEPGLSELPKLSAAYLKSQRFTEGHSIWPALLYRRTGQFEEAELYLQRLDGHPARGVYEQPFIDREAARLSAARGQWDAALELLGRANAGYAALAMRQQVQTDPGLEQGAQFKVGSRLLAELEGLLI